MNEPPVLIITFRGSRKLKFDIDYKNKFIEFEIWVINCENNGPPSFLAKTSNLFCIINEEMGLMPTHAYIFKCRATINLNQYSDWSRDLKVKMISCILFFL